MVLLLEGVLPPRLDGDLLPLNGDMFPLPLAGVVLADNLPDFPDLVLLGISPRVPLLAETLLLGEALPDLPDRRDLTGAALAASQRAC